MEIENLKWGAKVLWNYNSSRKCCKSPSSQTEDLTSEGRGMYPNNPKRGIQCSRTSSTASNKPAEKACDACMHLHAHIHELMDVFLYYEEDLWWCLPLFSYHTLACRNFVYNGSFHKLRDVYRVANWQATSTLDRSWCWALHLSCILTFSLWIMVLVLGSRGRATKWSVRSMANHALFERFVIDMAKKRSYIYKWGVHLNHDS